MAQVSTSDAAASFSGEVKAGTTRIEWEHFSDDADQFFLIARGQRSTAEEYCVPLTDYCYPIFSDWRENGEIVLELDGQGGQANTATVANVEQRLCPDSFDPDQDDYRLIYQMRAFADGRPAEPEFSNTVEVFCDPSASQLPRELR